MYANADSDARAAGPKAAPFDINWMRATPTLAEMDRIEAMPLPSLQDVARAHLQLLEMLEEMSGWTGHFRLHIATTKRVLGEA